MYLVGLQDQDITDDHITSIEEATEQMKTDKALPIFSSIRVSTLLIHRGTRQMST